MPNAREYILYTSGSFFLLGSLTFVFGTGTAGYEWVPFGIFVSAGSALLLTGLLVKRRLNPSEIRKCAYFVFVVGTLAFAVSALLGWRIWELSGLAACGAYAAVMYVLSVRLSKHGYATET